MDKNTITGLLLIFAILIGFSIWQAPSEEEIQLRREKDSLESVAKQKEQASAALIAAERKKILDEKTPQQNVSDVNNVSQNFSALQDKLGAFAGAGQGEDKSFCVETDLLKITLNSKGGRVAKVELKDFQTYDSLPLVLFTPDSSKFDISFFANNRAINTGELYFQPVFDAERNITVSGDESVDLTMRLYTSNADGTVNNNKYIDYIYSIKGDSYMLDYNIKFVGMNDIITSSTSYLNFDWNAKLRRQDIQLKNAGGATIYYKYLNDEVDNLSETSDEQENFSTKLKWVSFKQRFFSSVLLSENGFVNAELEVLTEGDPENLEGDYLKTMNSSLTVAYEAVDGFNVPLNFYFGPNKYKLLKSFDEDLELMIPLGWGILGWINRFAVIPVFNILENSNLNYGIIILILTVLLKLFLFPIAYKTYSSSAKMRVLKPEIEEIGKTFPKKEDAMKKQQATMALYKKVGVNPAAGCVPMLLQFPILIAMFRFFPASFELRQESFLWATDLSSYDSIAQLPFTIPFYGDHVSLFTLLMTVSTIFYTKMNSEMMGTGNNQMPGMKTMMYFMPVMLLGFLNNYAAALSYYYLLANLITFAQMYFIRRFIDEDKIRKKLLANKKKPVKKSKWQARLETMAKQQQAKRK
ncbi:MAG: membrane protein insertase YidC [Bacteroidota bacterium]|nr:membrane protein insertase YidC [Bacteroidota bacterium]